MRVYTVLKSIVAENRPSGELIFFLMFFRPDTGTWCQSWLSRLEIYELVRHFQVILGSHLSDECLHLVLRCRQRCRSTKWLLDSLSQTSTLSFSQTYLQYSAVWHVYRSSLLTMQHVGLASRKWHNRCIEIHKSKTKFKGASCFNGTQNNYKLIHHQHSSSSFLLSSFLYYITWAK